MGRRGGAKRAPNTNTASGSKDTISLREELTGKKQSVNPKSALKLEHLQRLALWATGEAPIPSLGAFFGQKLASSHEALGVPPDPSLFPCQRCETILQPGFNCTVRIEKNRAKARRRSKKYINFTQNKKHTNFTQNNVVYTCHFCSHRNLRRGTPKGHMKEICPLKTKTTSKLKPAKSISKKLVSSKKRIVSEGEVGIANEIASLAITREIPTLDSPAGEDKVSKANEVASSAIAREIPTVDSPATPLVRTGATLLESKRRKRSKSASKKPAEPENTPAPTDAEITVSTSNKRRRKSWTSLKEIAESRERSNIQNISDLKIPFFV